MRRVRGELGGSIVLPSNLLPLAGQRVKEENHPSAKDEIPAPWAIVSNRGCQLRQTTQPKTTAVSHCQTSILLLEQFKSTNGNTKKMMTETTVRGTPLFEVEESSVIAGRGEGVKHHSGNQTDCKLVEPNWQISTLQKMSRQSEL